LPSVGDVGTEPSLRTTTAVPKSRSDGLCQASATRPPRARTTNRLTGFGGAVSTPDVGVADPVTPDEVLAS